MSKIAFIGGGNMASCMIGGMLANGFQAQQICVANPGQEKRDSLEQAYGVATTPDNHIAVAGAEVIVLAVKPQVMGAVAQELAGSIDADALVVSVAAGVQLADLQHWLGGDQAIVRAMPNTPSMVRYGAAGLFANNHVNTIQKHSIEAMFNAIGICCWVENEALIDAVIAVSGSGPAYFFLMMEAMQRVGQELGLPEETALQLTIQTALGAAQMAISSELDTSQLRRQVTSPGGTTAAAIAAFQERDIEGSFRQAMQAAVNRARAMASEFSDQN